MLLQKKKVYVVSVSHKYQKPHWGFTIGQGKVWLIVYMYMYMYWVYKGLTSIDNSNGYPIQSLSLSLFNWAMSLLNSSNPVATPDIEEGPSSSS